MRNVIDKLLRAWFSYYVAKGRALSESVTIETIPFNLLGSLTQFPGPESLRWCVFNTDIGTSVYTRALGYTLNSSLSCTVLNDPPVA